jgi:uncharacterized protein (DUF433 family)
MSTAVLDVARAEAPPLRTDSGGVVRVGRTRVSLDSVAYAFERGATAEEIVESFPTLTLAEAYAVIAWYLRHRTEVQAYLDAQRAKEDETQRRWEERYPQNGLRERLLARRDGLKQP